jgi:hypothetical protein
MLSNSWAIALNVWMSLWVAVLVTLFALYVGTQDVAFALWGGGIYVVGLIISIVLYDRATVDK